MRRAVATITDIFDDHKAELVFVPPFATLVLDRATCPADVAACILEVRAEYATLRKNLSALESNRKAATSIGDRLKIRKEQRFLLDAVGSAFDRPGRLSLEGIIRYIPEALKPATAPSDPTKYTANLLLLPAHELAQWWRRRPIAPFIDIAERLKQVTSYRTRLTELFGETVIPDRQRW